MPAAPTPPSGGPPSFTCRASRRIIEPFPVALSSVLRTALPLAAAVDGYLLSALLLAVLAGALALLLLSRRRRPEPVSGSDASQPLADPAPEQPEDPLAPVTSLSMGLSHAKDAEAVARVLVDEVVTVLKTEFAALATIDEALAKAKTLKQ